MTVKYKFLLHGVSMSKSIYLKVGWVTFIKNFRGNGRRPPTATGMRKLSHSIVCTIVGLAMLEQYRLVSDRRTDRQTHDDSKHRTSISVAWVKNKRLGWSAVLQASKSPRITIGA